jgi:hypothetical protein
MAHPQGRQCHCGSAGCRRLLCRVVEQCPPEPAAGAARVNRYLVDVQAAVDHRGDEEASWTVISARDHPQSPSVLAGGEHVGSPQQPGDLRPADVVVHLRRCTVDLMHAGKVSFAGKSDTHRSSIAAEIHAVPPLRIQQSKAPHTSGHLASVCVTAGLNNRTVNIKRPAKRPVSGSPASTPAPRRPHRRLVSGTTRWQRRARSRTADRYRSRRLSERLAGKRRRWCIAAQRELLRLARCRGSGTGSGVQRRLRACQTSLRAGSGRALGGR